MKNKDLLKEKRKALGLSQAAVGDYIGVSQQHIDRIEKGYPVPMDKASKLAEILQIDVSEFIPEELLPHLAGASAIANKITSLFSKKEDMVTIDMIDATACCGDGIDNLPEKVNGHWVLPMVEFKALASCSPKDVKMLKVQGDSMTPTISEGDYVWVDTSNNYVGSDGIYLIRMATGLAVKRLQAGLSNVVIKSDNPTYSDITADVGELKIVGKVVHILNSRRA